VDNIKGRDGVCYIISDDEKQQFLDKGYCVLHDVLTTEEVAAFEDTYMAFARGEVSGMGRDFCDMSGPYDRAFEDYALINAMLPRKYRPELQGNIYEQLTQSIAEQLIGETAVYDYDQFLSKKPSKGDAAFAMHQDLGYWPIGTPDTMTTTCSLALDDADAENGCLAVVPGSHLEAALRAHHPVYKSDDDDIRGGGHTLALEMKPNDETVLLPVRRGDVTVHNERIVHGSGGNISSRWRRTYVIAHRSQACVDYERSIGFTHSHNDDVHWKSHLSALDV
jgi:ectoine hydroxylase-related dioxygenase (phytanoyl-CoA dioxygenase family)